MQIPFKFIYSANYLSTNPYKIFSFQPITDSNNFLKLKRTAFVAVLFRRRYFVFMGCSKNYIMYWGVFTIVIIAWCNPKVCTNITIFYIIFCAISLPIFSVFPNCAIIRHLSLFLCHFFHPQTKLQIPHR